MTDFVPSIVISISLDVSVVEPDQVVNNDPELGFAEAILRKLVLEVAWADP